MTTISQSAEFSIPTRNPVEQIITPILPQFDKLIQTYALFNFLFLGLGFFEFALMVIFFTFLAQSAILAFSLAILFLTFFSYFILRLYFQTRKVAECQELKERFMTACKGVMNFKDGQQSHHVNLANACTKLSETLKNRENNYYKFSNSLSFLNPYIEKFSYWYHWNDIFKMQELLLLSAIEENIRLIITEPTNPKTHAALATAYTTLADLYLDAQQIDSPQWLPEASLIKECEQKFIATTHKAIEEYKILSDLAPDDPWAHSQLSLCYRNLKMNHEELKECEIILTLSPDNTDVLLKTGILYFQQGFNCKGLTLYDQLRKLDLTKAEEMIRHYGGIKS